MNSDEPHKIMLFLMYKSFILSGHLKLILGFFVLDPDLSLGLGVNQQGKSCSFCNNNPILDGQVIIGQPL